MAVIQVNQPCLLFIAKCWKTTVGNKIRTVRKTNKQTQNTVRKNYRLRERAYDALQQEVLARIRKNHFKIRKLLKKSSNRQTILLCDVF